MGHLRGEPPVPPGNVINLHAHRARRQGPGRIVRIAPENDGLRVLYTNDLHPDRMMSLDIIGWALHEDGSTAALVPWLRSVTSAAALADPLNGRCAGYWDPGRERLVEDTPPHHRAELEAARDYFGTAANDHRIVVQTLPDSAGTHAVMSADRFRTVTLLEIVGWQLRGDGSLLALAADGERVTETPVLADDPCLYAVQEREAFRYFFQRGVANQVKRHDPEALACLAILAAD